MYRRIRNVGRLWNDLKPTRVNGLEREKSYGPIVSTAVEVGPKEERAMTWSLNRGLVASSSERRTAAIGNSVK